MRVGVDRLFGCFTPPLALVVGVDATAPARAPSTSGLVPGHAYSVIKAVEFEGRRFLRCALVTVRRITLRASLMSPIFYNTASVTPGETHGKAGGATEVANGASNGAKTSLRRLTTDLVTRGSSSWSTPIS